jgi:hypothetical protein
MSLNFPEVTASKEPGVGPMGVDLAGEMNALADSHEPENTVVAHGDIDGAPGWSRAPIESRIPALRPAQRPTGAARRPVRPAAGPRP